MKKNIIKVLFIGIALSWMGLIFYFSHQTGVQSSSMSGKITNTILHWFVPSFDDLSELKQQEIFYNTSFVIRKLGHYFEYAILGLFLYLMVYNFTKKQSVLFSLVSAIGLLYAISDEFHQSFIGGRSPMFKDVIIDFCGILTMLLCIEIFLTLKKTLKKR